MLPSLPNELDSFALFSTPILLVHHFVSSERAFSRDNLESPRNPHQASHAAVGKDRPSITRLSLD